MFGYENMTFFGLVGPISVGDILPPRLTREPGWERVVDLGLFGVGFLKDAKLNSRNTVPG